MSTNELIKELRNLPKEQLRHVFEQVGYVMHDQERHASMPREDETANGLTPDLLRGTFPFIADDFDAELPEQFWLGDQGAA